MSATVTHPKCGKSWTQHGNRTGHCAKCHETFEGITVFDMHQLIGEDGRVTCRDPRTITIGKAKVPLRLVDGSWRGPGMPNAVKAKYAQER
jgi:hypothetical protein